MMAPPRMPSPIPRPQPRQPAWASLGMETAASANTPAAAMAVIVAFMLLPRQEMIAVRSLVAQVLSNHACDSTQGAGQLAAISDAPSCPQAVVRPRGCACSGQPAGFGASQS